MRNSFFGALARLAERDERVVLLTGDLGYSVLEPFAAAFPQRFVNAGVAEQNMVGVATGLADAGLIPFVYSIVPFAVLRPYEFIRNGPVHHRLPVRIVGVGGGLEYVHDGISHFGIDDVGAMRLQPGLTTVTPADHEQAVTALEATWQLPGPVYYRLGKDDRTVGANLDGRFELGRLEVLGDGADVLLVTMGSVTIEATTAADRLADLGIHATVAVVASFNPAPTADLARIIAKHSVVVSVEAHYVTGGVGSLAAEVIAEHGSTCRLIRCGITEQPSGMTGSQPYLYDHHGISSDALVRLVRDTVGRRTPAPGACPLD